MKHFKLKSFFLFIIVNHSTFAYQTQHNIIVEKAIKHDLSIPLHDVPAHDKSYGVQSLINQLTTASTLIPLKAFLGIGMGLGHYQPTTAAPNLSGAVGSTQYFQFVDPDIAVFDKRTGTLVSGFPKPGNSIWFGFGGACETQNTGTPTVRYDQLAHRWILTREAYDSLLTGPFYQCVAVSTTDDATGSYYRYAFAMDSLSKDGSLALWTDAYYLSLSMFGPTSQGPRACALDRDKMLIGDDASIQCKQLEDNQNAIKPVNLIGNTAEAGYPGYFFSLNQPNNLIMYKFSVDWSNPDQTTMTSPISIPVPSFVSPCPTSNGNCAVQPNTINMLNVDGESLSRINFRQFPTFNSFVLTHNIQGPPPKLSPAVRWYELRMASNPTANPIVYQQQSFAPDSKSRFTASIVIDRLQNIAMGYNISSTAIYPSIEMAYRNYFDILNNLTLQPMITGLGAQLEGSNWTNHSSMSVDPIDDCTYWFSGEYIKESGSFNWSTAVVHFKLNACD